MTTQPEIPPPPWQRLPDRPARRRREPISREAIVTAAIQLLDREGLAALSMRRLGDELGVGAASLYWHVGSKDSLLARLQEAADAARDYIASLPAALFPNMTSLAGEFALADPDERFELLVEIFVDGLARRAAAG
jgi:AcrR family transcriptional regulator